MSAEDFVFTMINIWFGHFLADFFLQTTEMADNKFVQTRNGTYWCTIHVIVYTLTIMLFLEQKDVVVFLGIFIPHWIIDRYSLAYKWMKITGGSAMLSGNKEVASHPFGPVVYVVMDQMLHLFSLYLLLRYISIF